jgi:hypothetical protein
MIGARRYLAFALLVVGCAHYPKFVPVEPAREPVVYVLTHDAWYAVDGYFEQGPHFAPTLQTEGGPTPHMAVVFLDGGTRLEVVATYRIQYRDGAPELWAIATPADPERCTLFVSIPLQLLGDAPAPHPWFPADALNAVPDPTRSFDGAVRRCAEEGLEQQGFSHWVPVPGRSDE